ncbi:ABC transporter permease [Ruania halotolerans]|uniref:ABC transporter permease n=1 Tax=Ruania halotolerans TaxID=2897773 RepID=UPI001E3CEFF7|nr:ABC-2 family transporter protein [Ruania halotolerans]UFU05767.1 ABC-2 family transporter protein [Ruania halotolerans]
MLVAALLQYAVLGFRRWSSYRLAAAAGAFTNSVFGLIKAAITMGAIGAAGGTLAGYDPLTGATYAWLAQAFLSTVHLFGWSDFALRIRSGDVAIDLARPIDPQWGYLAADLGRAAFQLVPRGAPPVLAGALVTGLALPTHPQPYLIGLASLTLAVVVSFACRWLLNLAAFWLMELRGLNTLYLVSSNVLCGLVVPVHWFPDWLATLASCAPFPAMLQYPIDIVTGRATATDAAWLLLEQASWAVGLLLVGRLIFAAGVRRVVVQGG